MRKVTKNAPIMKRTGLREYAFTFLSFVVPGLSKKIERYNEIDRDTRVKHLETEIQTKETLAKMDAMLAAYQKKQSGSHTPSID